MVWQLAEPFSALSHLLGALFALLGGVFLIRRGRPSRERLAALWIYVAGVVTFLTASGLYHLAGPEHPWHAPLRRLDHAAIWLQIAGTFTPVHVFFFLGGWRLWPLVVVWSGAALGVLLKLVFFEAVPEGLGLALYLALGWSGVFSAVQLLRVHGWRVVAPVFHGGVAYSVGALLELARWPTLVPGVIGPHELFHVAVLIGVACHWTFIRRWALTPPTAEGPAVRLPVEA